MVQSSIGIITAINPHVGYENAANVAKESLKTGKTVRELTIEKGLLTSEELDIILDVFNMTNPGISGKELIDKKKKNK